MTARPSRRSSAITAIAAALAVAALVAGCAAPAGGGSPTPAPVQAATTLFIHTDTVLGPKNLTDAEKPTKTCVFANRFAHNEQIVWRVRVMDPATGKPMDDKGLKSVQVKFADQTLDLKYGPHPKDNPLDFFWTTSWTVPAVYPSGSLPYTITATAPDGRTGTFEQFKIPFAMLQITDDVRKPVG